MTPEQKQRAIKLIAGWRAVFWRDAGNDMAALLQELIDAPEPEPFGYFKAEPFGWTDCSETDEGAIALYTAPPAQSVPDADLVKDAERLNWLLRKLPGDALRHCVGVLSDTSDEDEFREAIDAAIAADLGK